MNEDPKPLIATGEDPEAPLGANFQLQALQDKKVDIQDDLAS